MAVPIFCRKLKLCELQGQRTQATRIKYHVIMLGTVKNYRCQVELTIFFTQMKMSGNKTKRNECVEYQS